jgi:hypothetical protein
LSKEINSNDSIDIVYKHVNPCHILFKIQIYIVGIKSLIILLHHNQDAFVPWGKRWESGNEENIWIEQILTIVFAFLS